MKRKIITIEVETEATNRDIKRRYPSGERIYIGATEQHMTVMGIVKQVTVNDVTPKAAKKKARRK